MIGQRLAELGAIRIDADQLARDAVAPGSPGLRKVVGRFGLAVLDESGALNRPELGKIVFGDGEALSDLNGIVHPEVHRLYLEAVSAAESENPDAIVVYEIPLLAETGGAERFDLVVVAEAPAETRVQRMVELRGMTEADARARLAHQADDATRRSLADVLIDTSGSEAETIAQVDALWKSLQR